MPTANLQMILQVIDSVTNQQTCRASVGNINCACADYQYSNYGVPPGGYFDLTVGTLQTSGVYIKNSTVGATVSVFFSVAGAVNQVFTLPYGAMFMYFDPNESRVGPFDLSIQTDIQAIVEVLFWF